MVLPKRSDLGHGHRQTMSAVDHLLEYMGQISSIQPGIDKIHRRGNEEHAGPLWQLAGEAPVVPNRQVSCRGGGIVCWLILGKASSLVNALLLSRVLVYLDIRCCIVVLFNVVVLVTVRLCFFVLYFFVTFEYMM